MNEHGFIRKIHSRLPPEIEAWKINDTNKLGVADCYYDGGGCDGSVLFVEYKWRKALTARATTIITDWGVSPIQREWLLGRYKRNIRVAVIVGMENNQAIIFPGQSWDRPISTHAARGMVVPHQEVVLWVVQMACTPGKLNE